METSEVSAIASGSSVSTAEQAKQSEGETPSHDQLLIKSYIIIDKVLDIVNLKLLPFLFFGIRVANRTLAMSQPLLREVLTRTLDARSVKLRGPVARPESSRGRGFDMECPGPDSRSTSLFHGIRAMHGSVELFELDQRERC